MRAVCVFGTLGRSRKQLPQGLSAVPGQLALTPGNIRRPRCTVETLPISSCLTALHTFLCSSSSTDKRPGTSPSQDLEAVPVLPCLQPILSTGLHPYVCGTKQKEGHPAHVIQNVITRMFEDAVHLYL